MDNWMVPDPRFPNTLLWWFLGLCTTATALAAAAGWWIAAGILAAICLYLVYLIHKDATGKK